MADPTVHITNGVPDSGTGNITTLGQTLLDGANVTIGAKADAKSPATDTTSITAMSVWKQVSASVQALVTAFGAALTRGAGASDSNTQRVTIDSGQLSSTVSADQASNAAGVIVRTPPQEVHLGEVGGKSAYRVITMSADTSILASGDIIADTQQYDAFFRKADGTGVINSITITEKDAQGAAYYILIHRTSTSLGSENSGPNITDANFVAGIQHIIAVATTDFVAVASSGTGSGTKVATLKNLGLPVMAVSGTDDLYFSILNATGTPTYASGEIQLGIGVMLD
jgi:hypothetical protein